MDCKKASILIMKFLDHDITLTDKAALDSHISECKNCREEFETLNSALIDVEMLEVFDTPEDLENMIMNRIDKRKYSKKNSSFGLIFIPLSILTIFIGHYTFFSILPRILINQEFIKETLILFIVKSTNLIVNYLPNLIKGFLKLYEILESRSIYYYGLTSIWLFLTFISIYYGWNRVIKFRRS